MHSGHLELQDKTVHSLFRLDDSPKVSNFAWPAVSGTLPTCLQLLKRHVVISPICPICQEAEESTFHALVGCCFARACWNRSLVSICSWSADSFGSWFQALSARISSQALEEAAMVTWSIWKARNEVVWQQKSPTAASVVLSARSFLDQFRFAQSRTTSSLSNSSIGLSSRVHWITPISDQIKVNVDSALFNDVSRFGMGCLACNHVGQVLEAFTSSREGIVGPEIAEIIGIKEAVNWIQRHNLQNVLLETDSLVCV
ncbi:uncharacterized protein LOC133034003 [Cannabis sativa]|uniref:uncharacterized protein LOC133034003 n=1 Tax=Cannabis sativa TaxID=3483 RepID=UPI0029CA9C05|nr:uncharacterized protein LOC133034003 [Cannabis sativa]